MALFDHWDSNPPLTVVAGLLSFCVIPFTQHFYLLGGREMGLTYYRPMPIYAEEMAKAMNTRPMLTPELPSHLRSVEISRSTRRANHPGRASPCYGNFIEVGSTLWGAPPQSFIYRNFEAPITEATPLRSHLIFKHPEWRVRRHHTCWLTNHVHLFAGISRHRRLLRCVEEFRNAPLPPARTAFHWL
jgi:hypothetical protein